MRLSVAVEAEHSHCGERVQGGDFHQVIVEPVQSFGQAANGTVVENPNGTLNYTPNAGFSGDDNFTYIVSDGRDEDAPATVTVTVSLDDPFA